MTGFRDDLLIRMAFSMHSTPGVYALLLGSGVSRYAGIPTGWEIVLDSIKKIGAMEGETQIQDPVKWYIERYKESPDYSNILDKLANTQAERSNLLHPYFEPTDDEREEGLKVPTEAHRSIATLVKHGYIRMILTTNFDRLLEKALEEEEITPTIISTDDALKGALPYIHNKCTIIKLHGDYKDTRIKNTSKELSKYSNELNEYLYRVLDEFGFIISGWSADGDLALKDAFCRRKNGHFSTVWTTRGKPSDDAESLINKLQAKTISIESADQFFTELLEKVETLRDMKSPRPSSVPLAIATVKRYLSEEKHNIRLHDLVTEETDRVCRELASDRFETKVDSLDKEILQKRIHEYEELVGVLIGILSTLAYYDKGKQHNNLITESINQLLRVPRTFGNVGLLNLQYYPALLLICSIGLTALKRDNYNALAAVLLESRYINRKGVVEPPIYLYLDMHRLFEFEEHIFNIQNVKRGSPQPLMSQHIYEVLREPLRCHLQNDVEYEEIFDIFEYLLGLIYVHVKYPDIEVQEKVTAVHGRFISRYYGRFSDKSAFSPINHFVQKGLSKDKEWDLLKAGFFGGGPRSFKLCQDAYDNYLKNVLDG